MWTFIIFLNIDYFVEDGISVLQVGSLKVYNIPKWKFSKQRPYIILFKAK